MDADDYINNLNSLTLNDQRSKCRWVKKRKQSRIKRDNTIVEQGIRPFDPLYDDNISKVMSKKSQKKVPKNVEKQKNLSFEFEPINEKALRKLNGPISCQSNEQIERRIKQRIQDRLSDISADSRSSSSSSSFKTALNCSFETQSDYSTAESTSFCHRNTFYDNNDEDDEFVFQLPSSMKKLMISKDNF